MNNNGPKISLVPRGLFCTNTLHRVCFKNRDPAHASTVSVAMLTSFTQLEAERVGRIYGGGVLKFELKDARRLPLLVPPNPVRVETLNRLDEALRAGELDFATQIADEAILPQFFGSEWPSIQSEMLADISTLRARRGILRETPKARRSSRIGERTSMRFCTSNCHGKLQNCGDIEWIGQQTFEQH